MNEANFALAAEIIPETYIKIASQARKQRENIIKNLLSHVRTQIYRNHNFRQANQIKNIFSSRINLTRKSIILISY